DRRRSRNLAVPGVIAIDPTEAAPLLLDQPASNPVSGVSAQDAAYIMYTSGSTGQPKGVVVEHRHLMHSTCSRMQHYGKSVKNFILIPSIAFDASIPVIFWTLSCGGTLSLPTQGVEQDVVRLANWIQEQGITHWLSVP